MSYDTIFNYLPGKDCGNCEYEGCAEFVKALSERKITVDKCSEIEFKLRNQRFAEVDYTGVTKGKFDLRIDKGKYD